MSSSGTLRDGSLGYHTRTPLLPVSACRRPIFCDRFNLNIVQPRIYDLNLVPTVWIKCVDIDTFENFTAACAMR